MKKIKVQNDYTCRFSGLVASGIWVVKPMSSQLLNSNGDRLVMDKASRITFGNLSKDKVLVLLSRRLDCPVESLSFLFRNSNPRDIKPIDIDIPSLRDY